MTAPAATAAATATPSAGPGWHVPTRRVAELGLIVFALLIALAFAAGAEAALIQDVSLDVITMPAIMAVFAVGAHIAVRMFAPYADPVILPCVILLNALGVVFIRRIDLGKKDPAQRIGLSEFTGLGFQQLVFTGAAVLGFCVALAVLRDHRSLSRYAYTLALAGMVLVAIPAVLPARFSEAGGAKLWIRIPGVGQMQPSEFAKLALLTFFAYYLVRKREVLSLASKRILGIHFPRGRDLGPVLVIWVFSLLVLIFEKDLGTSLMYFGTFIAMLYIATERTSWLIIGVGLFMLGATLAYSLFAHMQRRVGVWLDPFEDPDRSGFQMIQSLFGLGTGGLFGAGPGAGSPQEIPVVRSDFITAGLGEEAGLFGLSAILAVYLIIVVRGMRAAVMVRDSFGKLLAAGLAFSLGLQVFVIVGGVSKLIPLTGLTTPFLSYGGSSLVANWLLLAVLVRISDAARRPADTPPLGRFGEVLRR